MRRRWKWLIGGVAVVVVLAVAGPFIYIHFIEGPAPAKLTLPTSHGRSSSSAGGSRSVAAVSGTYHVAAGSEAGYRVAEVLVGQHATAVGRTKKIWGSVTIDGDSLTAATVSVDMASVVSDQSQRNEQFDGRIMDVARYPTATLRLASPVLLGTVAPIGQKSTYPVSAMLSLHGVMRTVHFSVTTERTADGLYVLADVPIVFSQWGISNPSVGGFVTTADAGTLEVLVHLTAAAGNAPSSGSGATTNGGGPAAPVTVPRTTVPKITIPSG